MQGRIGPLCVTLQFESLGTAWEFWLKRRVTANANGGGRTRSYGNAKLERVEKRQTDLRKESILLLEIPLCASEKKSGNFGVTQTLASMCCLLQHLGARAGAGGVGERASLHFAPSMRRAKKKR